jgi:hypothetical protein
LCNTERVRLAVPGISIEHRVPPCRQLIPLLESVPDTDFVSRSIRHELAAFDTARDDAKFVICAS